MSHWLAATPQPGKRQVTSRRRTAAASLRPGAVGGLPAPVALPGCIEDVPGLVGRVGGTDANPQVGIGEDPGEGIGHEHAEPRHTRAHCRPTQSAGPAPSVTDAEWPWPLPSSHSRWTEVPGLRAATIERKESADVTG